MLPAREIRSPKWTHKENDSREEKIKTNEGVKQRDNIRGDHTKSRSGGNSETVR